MHWAEHLLQMHVVPTHLYTASQRLQLQLGRAAGCCLLLQLLLLLLLLHCCCQSGQ
jgi:hypothetical protein